ncbi:DUF6339 family protein [Aeromonas sp. 700377]|uniref:DUF6339 family protein n=1 Tax=Aeromonas sp. 700377 TaxID=2712056 RepID=UPI003BA0A7D7
MPYVPLKYLSQSALDSLGNDISSNRERYISGDFSDLAKENGWEIKSNTVNVDLDALNELNGTKSTAEADIRNSLIVYKSLQGMTPALAREERLWVRLTHVECLQYSRARWIKNVNDEALDNTVKKHFFARGRTGVRDDNAISRLWWNMHVATIANPESPENALQLILKTADIRQAIVERPNIASRKHLAQAIVRAMDAIPWLTSSEVIFREFMKEMNRDAGGILFEAISASEADCILRKYSSRVKFNLENSEK